jgi:hypothetical protein
MSNLVTVNFHGSIIIAIEKEGEIFIAMKPIVESLGMDWSAQKKRIERDSVLSKVMAITAITTSGGIKPTTTIPLGYLNGFLFGIDDSRISDPDIKARVILYKQECYQVLYKHFHNKPQEHYQISDQIQIQNEILIAIKDVLSSQKAQIHYLEYNQKPLQTERDKTEEELKQAFNHLTSLYNKQSIELAVLKNTLDIHITNTSINKLTTQPQPTIERITIREAKLDHHLKNLVQKYISKTSTTTLANSLSYWVRKHHSTITKHNNCNYYPTILVRSFFNPNINPDISKIINTSPIVTPIK